jgi:hypothetical protein
MQNNRPNRWYIYLLIFHSFFLYAETLPSTIGSTSIGDTIFTTEGNGGIDVTHYDLNLTWDDVDFEQKLIAVKKTKTNEIRYMPMNEELFSMLKELRDSHPHWHYVFSKEDGTAYGNWRLAFQEACRRAGIKDFRFHDLRHTFASYLAMKGYNAFTIMLLTGHKTLSMVTRYTHLADRHVRDAVCVLGEKLGKKQVNDVVDGDYHFSPVKKGEDIVGGMEKLRLKPSQRPPYFPLFAQ